MRSSLGQIDENNAADEHTALVSSRTTGTTGSSDPEATAPMVHEVIDELGLGFAQFKVWLMAGGTWAADGAEILLVGAVTRTVAEEWHLTAEQRGTIVSTVFVGVMIGSWLSGLFGDQWGRRVPLILGYFGVFVCSVLSSVSINVWMLLALRCGLGISYGIGVPANLTLIAEVSPAKYRTAFQGCAQVLFAVGEFYGTALLYFDDPTLLHLHWRRLLLLGAIPSFILGTSAYFFLKESPLWLSAHGNTQATRDVLMSMRRANGHGGSVAINVRPSLLPRYDLSMAQQQAIVFSAEFRWTTFLTCVLTVTMNITMFGLLYAFPQVLPHMQMDLSPAANMMLGAAIELPAYLLGGVMGKWISRKAQFVWCFTGCAISLISFVHGDGYFTGVRDTKVLFASYMAIKFFAAMQFVSVYMYSTEVYPTPIRNSGTGVTAAAGRCGSIAAPILYETLTKYVNAYAFFFFVAGCGIFTSALVLIGLTTDNRNKHLSDKIETVAYAPNTGSSRV